MKVQIVPIFLAWMSILITACGALPQETSVVQTELPTVVSSTSTIPIEALGETIITPIIVYVSAPVQGRPVPTSSQAVTVGNYLLHPAELVLETSEPIGLVQWLPGSDEELLIRSATTDSFIIDVWNVATGQRKRVVETNSLASNPVWLPQAQQVAFVKQRGDQFDLYLSDPLSPTQAALITQDIGRPLALSPDQAKLLFFNGQMSVLQTLNQGLAKMSPVNLAKALPMLDGGVLPHYQAAWSEKTAWIAYYNQQAFYLVNPPTREERLVNLQPSKRPETEWWVYRAKWSSDGKKLALILASGQFIPLDITRLAVFDLETNQVEIVENDIRHVVDLAWSPDSRHIIVEMQKESVEGRGVMELFAVDSESKDITALSVIPEGVFQNTSRDSLAWSIGESQAILLNYDEKSGDGKSGWYVIKVERLSR